MPTTLDPDRFELPIIEGWPATDSRELLFTVTLADDTPKDLTNDTLEWALLEKPYHSRADAVITDGDSGVEIRTDVVDPTAGEFRVDIDEGALSGAWGTHHQRVAVDPPGESQQTWQGRVVLSDLE